MKLGLVLAVGVLVVGHSCPAPALDCARASLPVDKLICATPDLKKADAEMSAAYFKLLRETTDQQFHEALVKSQRRWLEVRSHGPDRYGQAEDDKTDDREVLLQITRNRLDFLQKAGPVHAMERERRVASGDSGGPFAGYKTSCVLLPPPYGSWTYGCWGEAHRQNGDRICSVGMQWASGHISENRLVSVLKDGAPQPVATCSRSPDSTDAPCPEPGDSATIRGDVRWNMNPVSSSDLPTPHADDLWKYDRDRSVVGARLPVRIDLSTYG
ncbi:lysozyme inhibitor LprI family protein [Bradyrhizobium sp. 41S5]|uniref:lysozyme inhibitor LprI family protein n=1 Tax=Bradyrhizobium sp. 41S5 TaxID=1404443 RepID=UPI001E56BE16|nr:lysozyme inhibitor LprI family protein [Bradyrhizobium sp. 41S5]UFX43147.1 lysozyme inhibitor LprI family protein [Bradyrhizobium sp. 41S5]